jgi:hypothetical protein
MENNRFKHSDAWIFLSLNNVEGGTSLEDLIAKADWINHAIPTEAEVEGAINRLAKAGLVDFQNSNLFLTHAGKELHEYIHSQGRSVLKLWERLEKHLNTASFPFVEVSDFKIKPKELHNAYKKYNKQFWKTYREIEKDEKKRGRS